MGFSTCRILSTVALLVGLWHTVDCQAVRTAIHVTIAVEDIVVLNRLTTLARDPQNVFPYSRSTGIAFNFTHVPVRGSLENVSSSEIVAQKLLAAKASAVMSDYYISMAMATHSIGIPYFIIKKYVFGFPPPGTPNIFEIEIDNYHLSQVLYDVSVVYKRTELVVVSDGSDSSGEFLVNFAGRTFSVKTVQTNATDESIYGVFADYNPNTLSSGMAWILLFDEQNLPLMERTLAQAARAGMFVGPQFFFIPTLYDKENYLTKFYRGDVEFYTFRLANSRLNRYTRDDLIYPFAVDAINHYIKAHLRWRTLSMNDTISDAILNEPTILDPATGTFTYNKVYRVRSNVRLEVIRSNNGLPSNDIFSLAGVWHDDGSGTPPYQPEYRGVDAVRRSRIIFAAFESEPYFYNYNSTSGSASGLCLEIVQAMQQQLGFEYKVVPTSGPNEVMDMLKNGSADVSLNFMLPNLQSREFLETSVDMVQDGIQMLNKKVTFTLDFFHVFRPFSFYVWMSIIIAIVLLSVTLYVCDKISPNTQGKPMYTPFESFFLVLSSFLMSKVETEPKKLSSRLFTLLLWFSTLLYMTTYLSNLVAFLISPDEQLIYATVGDLENTKRYKWGFVKDSLAQIEVSKAWPTVYTRAEKEWPNEMLFDTLDSAIARVLSDPYFILIASADMLSFVKIQDCSLQVMGNVANSHYLTWLFRKGFRFKSDLEGQLSANKDASYAQMRSKYFDLNRCYTGQTNPDNVAALGFPYLYGLFVLLGVGIAAGFLQLAVRWIFQRIQERRSSSGNSLRFKLGHKYRAEVYDAKPNGVYIRINGDKQVRFLDNSCLYPNMEERGNRQSNSKLNGTSIELQYLGKCSLTGARIFVRHLGNQVVTIAHSDSNSSFERDTYA